jgi:hypothetical protein
MKRQCGWGKRPINVMPPKFKRRGERHALRGGEHRNLCGGREVNDCCGIEEVNGEVGAAGELVKYSGNS